MAATLTRSLVSAAMGTRVGASLSTRDTVLWETLGNLRDIAHPDRPGAARQGRFGLGL